MDLVAASVLSVSAWSFPLAEEHLENIEGIVETTAADTTFLESLLTALVIELAFLRIAECLIGRGDELEFLTFIGILIRVVLQSEFSGNFETYL